MPARGCGHRYWSSVPSNRRDRRYRTAARLAPGHDRVVAVIATAITGTGTPVDPWTTALVGPLKLQVWKVPGANRIEIALAAAYMNDTLGERCTRLDASIGVGLLAIDLDAINDVALPFEMPDLSAGFTALSDLQWDAIEFLAGQLARLTPSSWVADLVDALGWTPSVPGTPASNRLRLAALVANPQAAILDWANTVLLRRASRIESLLSPLARVLTGAAGMTGSLYGTGRPRDPYRVPLSAIAGTPELTVWIEPDGPPLEFISAGRRPSSASPSPPQLRMRHGVPLPATASSI